MTRSHTVSPAGSSTARERDSAAQRWGSRLASLVAGGVSIVAGGLAAAVTGPTGWDRGSWVAAFLVLVGGVAQIGITAGRAHLAPAPPTGGFAVLEAVVWNGGCVVVIAGSLLSSPLTVSIGGALLGAALVMAVASVRRSQGRPLLLVLYRVLLVVLVVSIPIGTALSWARH